MTCAFLEGLFDACPHLERLNASFNAGLSSVLILKKPAYAEGARVHVDWRGRGQYWEAQIVKVHHPVQAFDVRYAIDGVLDKRVPPTRVQGYVKERKMRDRERHAEEVKKAREKQQQQYA